MGKRNGLLSSAKQIELFKDWKYNGNKSSYDRLIMCNQRAVYKEAHRASATNRAVSIEDLIQEGMLGLAKAAEKFDEKENVNFLTYAMPWIKQRIRKYILDNRTSVRLGTTEDGRKIFSGLGKARKLLEGKNLTKEEESQFIAKYLGVKKKSVDKMIGMINNPDISFSAPMKGGSEDNKRTFLDVFESENPLEANSEDQLCFKQYVSSVYKIMDKSFTSEEKAIIRSRYLDSDKTYDQIGKELGISRQKVRQVELFALKKLKAKLTLDYKITKEDVFYEG